jgi:hypothetical protein
MASLARETTCGTSKPKMWRMSSHPLHSAPSKPTSAKICEQCGIGKSSNACCHACYLSRERIIAHTVHHVSTQCTHPHPHVCRPLKGDFTPQYPCKQLMQNSGHAFPKLSFLPCDIAVHRSLSLLVYVPWYFLFPHVFALDCFWGHVPQDDLIATLFPGTPFSYNCAPSFLHSMSCGVPRSTCSSAFANRNVFASVLCSTQADSELVLSSRRYSGTSVGWRPHFLTPTQRVRSRLHLVTFEVFAWCVPSPLFHVHHCSPRLIPLPLITHKSMVFSLFSFTHFSSVACSESACPSKSLVVRFTPLTGLDCLEAHLCPVSTHFTNG